MKRLPVSSLGRQCCLQVAQNPGSVLSTKVSDDEVLSMHAKYRPASRRRVYDALVTLWTFTAQVLNSDKTLQAAVARTMAPAAVNGSGHPSHDPSAYCKARYRYPLEVLVNIVHLLAQRLEELVKEPFRWHNRRVVLFDGSTVSMPDTPENRRRFGQPSSQKKGCGFPVARIVGAFSLSAGAILDLVVGKLKDSELLMWRRLWHVMKPGDIALADRLFANFADICSLCSRKIDLVIRIDKTRNIDFSRGARLGPNDHLVEWSKPKQRPRRFSATEWAGMPETITLREVRFTLMVRGFRSTQIVLVTTLLDAKLYSVKELAKLYGRRWEVETDFAHLKTSMEMDILGGKKPEMIIKELWVFMLAYNLIRTVMWEAARRRHLNPLQISLAGAVKEVLALWPYAHLMPKDQLNAIYDLLVLLVGTHKIPRRPGRHEPRVLKRRHNGFSLMTSPRQSYKAEAVVMA